MKKKSKHKPASTGEVLKTGILVNGKPISSLTKKKKATNKKKDNENSG